MPPLDFRLPLRVDEMSTREFEELQRLTQQPLLLAPNRVFRSYTGGALLEALQGEAHPKDAHFPEEWVGSTTATRLSGRPRGEGLSRVVAADERNVLLKTLIETFPEAMLGEAHIAQYGKNLGVLCKLLDAATRLSMQTHPNRAFARRHLQSDFGKTESWIIIGTREIEGELPYILLGFRDGVTEADFRRITELQDTQAQMSALNRIAVHPGDVYMVPAGVPHAIGAGVFMIEVQEPTDFTVNIEFNYGGVQRTEEQCFLGLGFDLGMRCFDYGTGGMSCVQQNTLIPRTLRQDTQSREEILIGPEHTRYFGASRLVIRRTAADRDHGECYIGIVIQGCGQILSSTSEALPLRPGSAFFVPTASRHEAIQADPNTPLTLIRCFPPGSLPEGPRHSSP
jgi:mannose-6-phosphate isomerase